MRLAISGRFRAACKKYAQVPGEELNIAARTVFEDKGESAGSADARNRRRGKTEGHSRRQLAQLPVEMSLDRLKLLVSRLAGVPGLEGHRKERVVAGTNKTKQTEAHDGGRVLNPGGIHNDFFNVLRDRSRPLQRSRVGQLQIDIGVPLIFVGEEARGQAIGEEPRRNPKSHQQYNQYRSLL